MSHAQAPKSAAERVVAADGIQPAAVRIAEIVVAACACASRNGSILNKLKTSLGKAAGKPCLDALLPIAQADNQAARFIINGVSMASVGAAAFRMLPEADVRKQAVQVPKTRSERRLGRASLRLRSPFQLKCQDASPFGHIADFGHTAEGTAAEAGAQISPSRTMSLRPGIAMASMAARWLTQRSFSISVNSLVY